MMSRWIVVAVFVLSGLTPCSVFAQLQYIAQLTKGADVTGQVTSLTPDSVTLKLKSGEEQKLPLRSLICLKQQPKPEWKVLSPVGQSWVFLATGDRLCVFPSIIDDSTLTGVWNRFEVFPPVQLPLEVCRGVALTFPAEPVKQGLLLNSIESRRESSDLVALRNGDQLKGELFGLASGVVTIKTSLGEIKPKARLVERISFNPELVFAEKPAGPVDTMLLSDGSVLNLSTLTSDGLSIRGTMLSGTSLLLPIEHVHELRVSGGDSVSLAEFPPDRVTVEPYLDTKRPPRMNRNVLGGLLSVRGRPSLTGIGVVSGTTLEWDVDRSWKSFRANIGLDDAAKGEGSAVFEVLVDGRSHWKSEELTGKSSTVSVPEVSLVETKTLTLKVHFGQKGNVLDYADWLDAVLISR